MTTPSPTRQRGWTLHAHGRLQGPDDVVAPGERLSWPRTIGLGMQHVVAMFGATFVLPLLMGLDPQLAILCSGAATLLFLVATANKVPSYLGTSAAFVGPATAIGTDNPAAVTGAFLISGAVLALVGVAIHFLGTGFLLAVMPPAVTGAVVMLIGFNLAGVVAESYWPADQPVALLVMAFVLIVSVAARGFMARVGVFLAVMFGYLLSAAWDQLDGGKRVDLSGVEQAGWVGLPDFHAPTFELNYALLALPVVIALIAENVGHVKAVGEMTGDDLDPMVGRAVTADGVATVLATSVGGAPTTTYAENIGVMAASRVYSTAAYVVAALTAIALGFCPKFGALVAAVPAGVLAGVTLVLYGMIGLLGAKIWVEARVDFGDPVHLMPLGAGIIIAIGNVTLDLPGDFELGGIALGCVVLIAGYHLMRAIARRQPGHSANESRD